MSTQTTRTRVDDAEFLSTLIRTVREQPTQFRTGAALLESMFAAPVLRRRFAASARESRNAFGRTHPMRKLERDELHQLRERMSTKASAKRESLRAAESWVRARPAMMERAEAEAVVLVVAYLFDDHPRSCSALPDCLRGIPWGGIREPFVIVPGRFFRADALGFDSILLEQARIAWARIESWPRKTARTAAKPPVREARSEQTQAAEQPLGRRELRFLRILVSFPPTHLQTGPALCKEYARLHADDKYISEASFRKNIVPTLRRVFGLRNKPRVGYWLPKDSHGRSVDLGTDNRA